MTGQVQFDSYEYAGARTAVDLVNGLAVDHAFGRTVDHQEPRAIIAPIMSGDPTWPRLRNDDVSGLVVLAAQLRAAFDDLDRGDVDGAAHRLNKLLAAHPAHPYLAKQGRVWRLHHHPADAELVPMATAICAEALARVIGAGAADRLGTCGADECERVFLDGSKNGSRRFCSTTCQNRVKASTFRRRHGPGSASSVSS
jgi:predicted RNA-binding Zn ribbon-like protein